MLVRYEPTKMKIYVCCYFNDSVVVNQIDNLVRKEMLANMLKKKNI